LALDDRPHDRAPGDDASLEGSIDALPAQRSGATIRIPALHRDRRRPDRAGAAVLL